MAEILRLREGDGSRVAVVVGAAGAGKTSQAMASTTDDRVDQEIDSYIDSWIQKKLNEMAANKVTTTAHTPAAVHIRKHYEAIDKLRKLTKRQYEIAKMIADGMMNKECSAEIGVSVRTIEKHRANIMDKLGVKNCAGVAKIVALAELFED